MKNIKGFLIRTNRERLGLKQEYLAKDICAVSYLSKIEKGDVIPSDDIVDKLFIKLDISYCIDDTFVLKGKELFDDIYKANFIGLTIDEQKRIQISECKDRYLNSPLYIDYLLFTLFEKLNNNEKLMDINILQYKEYMDEEQLYKSYFITGVQKNDYELLEIAKNMKNTPEIISHMGLMKWLSGKYYEAIDLLLESLNLAYSQGYIKLQMEICLILGHIYMDFHIPTMKKYYNQALTISKLLDNMEYQFQVYYHLGVAFLKHDFYQSESNLLKAMELCQKDDVYNLELTLQKLCLLYIFHEKYKEAKQYYHKIFELNLKESRKQTAINELLNIMIHNNNYIYSKEYRNKLRSIYLYSKKHRKFSNTKFYGDYLIDAYKANRQYKEALLISEYIYSYLKSE